ncbi:MAG: hypothetical protein KDJ90_07825 [Nitratireductor sp.]|nr:hypothetical protein [Nitratireductor sp.]
MPIQQFILFKIEIDWFSPVLSVSFGCCTNCSANHDLGGAMPIKIQLNHDPSSFHDDLDFSGVDLAGETEDLRLVDHQGRNGLEREAGEEGEASAATGEPAFRPFAGEADAIVTPVEEPLRRDEEAAARRAEMLRAMRQKMRSEFEEESGTGDDVGLLAVLGKRFRGLLN